MRVKDNDKNLPSDEIERRKLKRERNKIAAAKCRQRRLDRINYLTQKTENLKNIGVKLERDIKEMEEIEHKYQNILNSHECSFKGSLLNDYNVTNDDSLKTSNIISYPHNSYEIPNNENITVSKTASLNINSKFLRPQTLDIKGVKLVSNLDVIDTHDVIDNSNMSVVKQESKLVSFSSFDAPILKTPLFSFPDMNTGDNKCLDYGDDIGTGNDLNTPVVFSFDSYGTRTSCLTTITTPMQPVVNYENLMTDEKPKDLLSL